MTQEKKLLVSAIKNGTVIDHIDAGHALKIIRILNLADHQKVVTVGLNLPSRAMKFKDIIKVEGRELTPEEANRVAILAPTANLNIIRNYEVVKKFNLKLPEKIDHLLVCPNLKCITNHEPMDSSFAVLPAGHEVKVKCVYCEKTFHQNEIQEYKI
ncbi:MAG: aspartate carbamoyltransferase regulatory subunit [Patescibacteria group bacterium]